MVRIASIVEGHGECEAVPILVRRIAQALDPALVLSVYPVLRVPASRLVKQGEIERAIEFAARKNSGQGAILVLLDCALASLSEQALADKPPEAEINLSRLACADRQRRRVLGIERNTTGSSARVRAIPGRRKASRWLPRCTQAAASPPTPCLAPS